jgi:hypothetical protein
MLMCVVSPDILDQCDVISFKSTMTANVYLMTVMTVRDVISATTMTPVMSMMSLMTKKSVSM